MVGIFIPLCKSSHSATSLTPPTFHTFSFLFISSPLSLSLSLSLSHRSSQFLACNNTTMNNISMGFSCGDDFDGEEGKAPLLYETRENQHSSSGCMDGHNHHHHHMQVEVDYEFWPVEHPLEPPDEDRPVKCPMPDSSVINEGGRKEKRFSETSSMRKRTEASSAAAAAYSNQGLTDQTVVAVETPPPARPVRKRHHHTLTRGDHMISPLRRMPPLPSLPTQSITVFQMLQQFDKFDS
ncbi:uncharacterized protein LOC103943118 isoform X2 [Pyrus x bretschneideri]|uniref:uncharacterized protein LOC103943118 isoform X2 n=1 Tax=Pyrus x bretschneideri TaxID=225117 RepID=UPI002030D67E|nr:uncharacterized protein LOC103943118 isoform X2 [Pyrus x bretschneideri]